MSDTLALAGRDEPMPRGSRAGMLALVGGGSVTTRTCGWPSWAILPFPDGMFDDVTASWLHYLEDWRSALAELRRVLKPGGRLIVSVDAPRSYRARLCDRRRP
jgi:SAM-dependent methyltransferase